MKMNIKVTELTHADLVNLLCTATYGNDGLDIEIPNEYKTLADNCGDKCLEDKWADVLLNGGEVDVIDIYSSECDTETLYGKMRKNWNLSYVKHVHGHNFFGEYDCYYRVYRISLKTLLKGLSNDNALDYLSKFNDGREDMYDAYNLIQIAVFGEEIYG